MWPYEKVSHLLSLAKKYKGDIKAIANKFGDNLSIKQITDKLVRIKKLLNKGISPNIDGIMTDQEVFEIIGTVFPEPSNPNSWHKEEIDFLFEQIK